MSPIHRVLIVDESAENRDVLRTLLARHGAATIEVPRADQAIQLANLHKPDLIVLDAESDHSVCGELTSRLHAEAERLAAPLVVLGTIPRQAAAPPPGQIVAKPYHYGALVRKIEQLLGAA